MGGYFSKSPFAAEWMTAACAAEVIHQTPPATATVATLATTPTVVGFDRMDGAGVSSGAGVGVVASAAGVVALALLAGAAQAVALVDPAGEALPAGHGMGPNEPTGQ